MAKSKVTVVWDKTKCGQARYKDNDYKMFYTKVMNGEKRLKGVVKDVSVEELLKDAPKNLNVAPTLAKIESGYPTSIPVLDKIHGKKIGLEIVAACKELGLKEVPCLVCEAKKTKKD